MKKLFVILCIVSVLCILLLVMPSAAANVAATVSPSTVAHGNKIFINGTAEGQPASVGIWIMGKNYATLWYETVNSDGTFNYEVTPGATMNLYSGQYFVVVQHPGMNGVYDIDWPVAQEYVFDFSGTTPVSIFKITGPGSLQGFDAFEALTQAIKTRQPSIDDTYTKAQFLIMPNLTASVFSSTVHHGDKIFINGTAEGQPASVGIWIMGKNYATLWYETVNSDGTFNYEVTPDTTMNLYSGQYFVVVQHPGMNGVYDIDWPVAQEYVFDFSGTTPVSIFKITGPGSLQGFDAFEALTRAIKTRQPFIDDTYTRAQFQIVGSSNVGVYRPSAHTFYLKNGTTTTSVNWGTSTDLPLTGDWNSDGRTDVGVYRPSTHTFYLKNGTTTAINWGVSTDLPVTGDWNGDGRTDVGIYRSSAHTFYLKNGTTTAVNWGISNDLPVTGDWNGDGKTDVGVFRPSNHMFYLKNGTTTAINWGISTDLPVTGDWNGDGRTDVGVYRPSAHTFYLKNGTTTTINWGTSTDLPVTGKW